MELKNSEETINRLIQEIAQDKKVLDDIRRILNSTPEFEGLSLIGGVAAILKSYHDEKEKCRELEKELMKLFT